MGNSHKIEKTRAIIDNSPIPFFGKSNEPPTESSDISPCLFSVTEQSHISPDAVYSNRPLLSSSS